jgi:peptide/nickel transport system substrate-binding protein
VYFSSDVANLDTYPHFVADLQMYTTTMTEPDPGSFMRQFLSSEAASKANKFQGRNIVRWQSEEYDKLFNAADVEIDPVKRAALFIAMNDHLIKNVVIVPVVARTGVAAVANNLHAPLSGWDNNTFALQDWYRDA